MGTRLTRAALALAAVTCLIAAAGHGPAADQDAEGDAEVTNPLGANAACYICHVTFVKEQISKVHLSANVACVKCHGPSLGHANDEDIGATPPDVSFSRGQVDAMCRECHPKHDVPAKDVVARFLKRRLAPESPSVCTDCHGSHRIEKPADEGALPRQ